MALPGHLSHHGMGRMPEESISYEDKNIFLLKYIQTRHVARPNSYSKGI